MKRHPRVIAVSPANLGPAVFLLAWSLLSVSVAAQETIQEAAPAQFRLSPSIGLAGQYNRVEGLPVMFGPVLERDGPNPFRIDAMAIWRTEMRVGTDPEAFGYRIEARQQWGTSKVFFVGGTAHSLISPIEQWQVSDLETSLSTFFLHQDFRDHVVRTGFSGFVGLEIPDSKLTARVTYGDEDHDFLPPGNPLALSGDPQLWRPQPLVGVGRARTVSAEVVFDDRDRPRDPDKGWYLSGRVTAAVGGSMSLPAYMEAGGGPTDPVADERPIETDFWTGFLEARRYFRFERSLTVKLRALVAGSLDGEPIPPQFQHALGGVGSLPGYPTFSADCGARSQVYSVFHGESSDTVRVPAFAGYGCDGFALFQIEFGGRIPFGIVVDPDPDELDGDSYSPPLFDFRPRWSVFFDAAQGWSMSEPGDAEFLGPDTDVLMDLGVGFSTGAVGLYWAWPLAGNGGEGNLFLRIAHRF